MHSRLTEVSSRLTGVCSGLTGVHSRLTGVYSVNRQPWIIDAAVNAQLHKWFSFGF